MYKIEFKNQVWKLSKIDEIGNRLLVKEAKHIKDLLSFINSEKEVQNV